jgi:Domain of unknown function (DUF4405)
MTKATVSKQTRNNWLIDAAVALGALITAITGVYFLFLPVGGYQGGRNPWYGVTVLFERHTWGDLHTWFGALMIAAVAVHFTLHWAWVQSMARRVSRVLTGQGASLNRRGYFNVAVDAAIAVSFVLVGISGIYFMFVPGGRGATGVSFLFSRTAWDMIHTWSGVALIIAATIHFAIHWRWVTKVTSNVFRSLAPQSLAPAPTRNAVDVNG